MTWLDLIATWLRSGRPQNLEIPRDHIPLSCPYCGVALKAGGSSEHIFPEFLGGRRTTKACTPCNNTIGPAVEGAAARETFKPFSLYLRSIGLKPAVAANRWPRAYEHDGKLYDLIPSPNGVRPELSAPLIERNDKGQIVAAEFQSEHEAAHFIRQQEARGNRVELTRLNNGPENLRGLTIAFHSSDALHRMTLKIAIAASSLLRQFHSDRVASVARFLDIAQTSANPIVLRIFSDVDALDDRRSPMSHVVYVEWNPRRAYSVVQYFGSFTYFVELGDGAPGEATECVLGILDPITGAESFTTAVSLDIPRPPDIYPCRYPEEPYERLFAKFEKQAKARGATHLKGGGVEVDFEVGDLAE